MCADGQYRWFHTSVAACHDDTGKTIALHGIMLETTAQKAAELALQQSERQYAEDDGHGFLRSCIRPHLMERLPSSIRGGA